MQWSDMLKSDGRWVQSGIVSVVEDGIRNFKMNSSGHHGVVLFEFDKAEMAHRLAMGIQYRPQKARKSTAEYQLL